MFNKEKEIEKLQESLVKELTKKYEGSAQIFPQNQVRSGDLTRYGIVIFLNDIKMNIAPFVHIEEYLEKYLKQEISVEEIASDIYKRIEERKTEIFCVGQEVKGLNSDYIYQNVRPKLINNERNEQYLKDFVKYKLPWTNEFCVAFHCVVNRNEEGEQSFMIRNELLKELSLDLDVLYQKSLKNSSKEHTINNIENVLFSLETDKSCKGYSFEEIEKVDFLSPYKMYILTNERGINGAEVILDKESMKKLENQIGAFFVLPSSIHECLAVPVTDMNAVSLKEMVLSVNATEVAHEDILGEKVYLFKHGNILEIRENMIEI